MNIFEHCKLLIVEDIHRDEAAIIRVLTEIHDQKLANDITLLNYYRELPVNFPASIMSIDRGVVEVKVHELQVASMLSQKSTFIKSSHLPHCVVANVLRVRRKSNHAFLTQFSYVRIQADQRAYVRVKVAGKIDAAFNNEKSMVRGRVEDISFRGIAIKVLEGCTLEEHSSGTITVWLPEDKLEVPGRHLKVQDKNIFIFEMDVDEKSEKILSQFIFQQQSQIIRELKDFYF